MNNNKVIMKKEIASWLIHNTSLSDEQIGEFCEIHPLQINNQRNNSKNKGQIGETIVYLMLTQEEIERCENDPTRKLVPIESTDFPKRKAPKKDINFYNAILWLLNEQFAPSIISKFLKCDVKTVISIKEETFKKFNELTPQNPVSINLCSQEDLDKLYNSKI